MKKVLFILVLTSLVMPLSCNQEDDDVDIASMVVGNYLGVLTVNDVPISSVTVLVNRVNNSTIEVSSSNDNVTPFKCKLLLTDDFVTASIADNSDVTIFVELLRNPPRFSYEFLTKEEEFIGNLVIQ